MNEVSVEKKQNIPAVSLFALMITFFKLGSITFGGMWGAVKEIEDELVRKTGWLTAEQLHAILVTATLIPAPRFLGMGGLIGFRLRGWIGSAISVFFLILPGALLVLLSVILLSPELLNGPLVTLRHAVGIATVGLLFGNAFHQMTGVKVKGRQKQIGIALTFMVAILAIAGVPLLISAVLGFFIGALFIRNRKEEKTQ